ncbi:MAG: PaaI family thioesterase [Clostridia bacterium]|nr:PaaI family thioesterase [Clostridia bacterium]
MGVFSSLEEAREYFQQDRFASGSGVELETLSDTECVCSMEIGEMHQNAMGGVMGGALFTLADFAFAVSSNHAHFPTVAQNVDIHFFNAPKGKRLTAVSSCLKNGKTTCVYQVVVEDESLQKVALFLATGFKLTQKQPPSRKA